MLEQLETLDALQERYDVLFCDVWGVVHNGRTAFQAAGAALTRFRAAGGRVVLLTNAPRPRGPIPAQLDRLGVPREAWDLIVTSGDATRALLAQRAPGPMYKIGPAYDGELWAGLNLREAPLEEAAFLAISGLRDDSRETPDDYREILAAARARDLELICANPDITVRYGERLIYCAGAVAQAYEETGGRVIMAGKPHTAIYDLAFAELGGSVDRSRTLAIGDGLGTDLLGAQRQGLDALFIAGGMHGAALLQPSGGVNPAAVRAALGQAGVSARYVLSELR